MTDNQPKAGHTSYTRRKSDMILAAFEQACDARREPIAANLLELLEQEIFRENTYPGRERRDPPDVLGKAQRRLEALRSVLSSTGSSTCSALLISQALSAGRWQHQGEGALAGSLA